MPSARKTPGGRALALVALAALLLASALALLASLEAGTSPPESEAPPQRRGSGAPSPAAPASPGLPGAGPDGNATRAADGAGGGNATIDPDPRNATEAASSAPTNESLYSDLLNATRAPEESNATASEANDTFGNATGAEGSASGGGEPDADAPAGLAQLANVAAVAVIGVVLVAGAFAGFRAFLARSRRGGDAASAAVAYRTMRDGAAYPVADPSAPNAAAIDGVVAAYRDACEALARFGCPKRDHETAREFAVRAPAECGVDDESLHELTSYFELARHAGWTVDDETAARARALADVLARAPVSAGGRLGR